MNKSYETISLIFLCVFSLFVGHLAHKCTEEPEVIVKEEIIIVNDEVLSLRDSIKQEILKYNFQYPEIVYAQAILESGNFLHPKYKETNNLFGMFVAKKRLNITSGKKYSHFEHWKYSIVDRALYEAQYLHGKEKQAYYAYLGKNYAEDVNYVHKLKSIVKSLNF